MITQKKTARPASFLALVQALRARHHCGWGLAALILTLLAQGLKNKDIVKRIGLTIHTVKYHTREAYSKLKVNNAGDAILKARELGFIE